jgi:hypothetical protein
MDSSENFLEILVIFFLNHNRKNYYNIKHRNLENEHYFQGWNKDLYFLIRKWTEINLNEGSKQ